jgi:hypothetical protein
VRQRDGRGALRDELELRIRTGRCVYCRAAAAPDRPLTREHVIPRARGGRRKDSRIIVPACARCNHRRGSQEVVLFLLARPRRIAAFLDYLHNLPADSVRELDPRVFAELYAAVWLLAESAAWGEEWRTRLRHLCSGRRLHRRRYAARRIMTAVSARLGRNRARSRGVDGPGCPLPDSTAFDRHPVVGSALAPAVAGLVGALSMLWDSPADRVAEELERERLQLMERSREPSPDEVRDEDRAEEEAGVVSLDRWRRRSARPRTRVDYRGGRGARRGSRPPRGRAA